MSERAQLAARLRERSGEIEQATLARVRSLADPATVGDPEYATGLTEAVGVGLAYGIDGIEASDRQPGPVPAALLSQARIAGRSGVSLDTVVRRYLAGYTLLGDFLMAETERVGPLAGAELQEILRGTAARFDRVLAAVSDEHAREAEGRTHGAEQRRAERIRKLLGGELVDAADLGYELEGWHIGAVATGPGARTALRELGAGLDRRLLAVLGGAGAVWGWLGGRSRLSAREVLRQAKRTLPAEVSLGLGEPGRGIEGWRLTHHQAKAAMMVARRGPDRRLRYADVALLAAALSDDVLAGSLHDIYLAPFEHERDAGVILRQTLAAYFDAGRNASSAAAALGVSRKTVSIRLRTVEEKIGQPVEGCAAELQTALRLRELTPLGSRGR